MPSKPGFGLSPELQRTPARHLCSCDDRGLGRMPHVSGDYRVHLNRRLSPAIKLLAQDRTSEVSVHSGLTKTASGGICRCETIKLKTSTTEIRNPTYKKPSPPSEIQNALFLIGL